MSTIIVGVNNIIQNMYYFLATCVTYMRPKDILNGLMYSLYKNRLFVGVRVYKFHALSSAIIFEGPICKFL